MLLAFAVPVNAGKTTYDPLSPMLMFLWEDENTRAAIGIARSCAIWGLAIEECITKIDLRAQVHSNGRTDEVLAESFSGLGKLSFEDMAYCGNKLRGPPPSHIDDDETLVAHTVGGGTPTTGVWHISYRDGHLHEWSPVMRDEAGLEAARRAIRDYKDSHRNIGGTVSLSWDPSVKVGLPMAIEAAIAKAEVGISAVVQASITVGGFSEDELRPVAEAAYAKGYEDPLRVGIQPDAVCERGEVFCTTSSSVPVWNPAMPLPPLPSGPQEGSSDSDSSSGGSPDTDVPDRNRLDSYPRDRDVPDSQPMEDEGSEEDDDPPDSDPPDSDPPDDGAPDSDFVQFPEGHMPEPLKACLMERANQRARIQYFVNIPIQGREPRLTREDREALTQGECPVLSLGREYCDAWYQEHATRGEAIAGDDITQNPAGDDNHNDDDLVTDIADPTETAFDPDTQSDPCSGPAWSTAMDPDCDPQEQGESEPTTTVLGLPLGSNSI